MKTAFLLLKSTFIPVNTISEWVLHFLNFNIHTPRFFKREIFFLLFFNFFPFFLGYIQIFSIFDEIKYNKYTPWQQFVLKHLN